MGRREISAQFKEDAVQRVLEKGHSVKTTAKELGISETALRRWLGPRLTTWADGIHYAKEQARIKALEGQVAELEKERAQLRESIAEIINAR
jgi:transposase